MGSYELKASFQSWEDMQSKINAEKQVKGINLEPLNVDELAGTVGPLLEVRYWVNPIELCFATF